MNEDEFRAITAQGPMVVQMDRLTLLALLDERADLRAALAIEKRRCLLLAAAATGGLGLWVSLLLITSGVL